jgi:hypothetical protein
MRYNLALPITTPHGQQMQEQTEQTVRHPETGAESKVNGKIPVTMGMVLSTIIFAETDEEQRNPQPKMKLQRFAIGQRLVAATRMPEDSQHVDLNVDEVKLLQQIAGKVCNINVFGQINHFLESPAASPAGVPGVTL